MRLTDLLKAAGYGGGLTHPALEREVRAVAHDSRAVTKAALFVAVRGYHSDGHRFIPQALEQGALAVVGERGRLPQHAGDALLIPVDDSRRALALLADAFYGHPSRRLALVGITGTNGKTTSAYLTHSVIAATGAQAGLIGTIAYRVGARVVPAPNTTPESLELQALLAEMADAGEHYCVMEVSSHAQSLGRTAGCTFAAAAFTNLTQDHLDYHGDMDAYFAAKRSLFAGLGQDATAVVNGDDARSGEIRQATRSRVLTFGMTEAADIRPAGPIRHDRAGLAFTAATPAGPVSVASPLVGRHNAYNILTAIGLGVGLGIAPDAISRGIANLRAVPGRMEIINEGQPFGVLVDYAHTDDALLRLLEAVREIAAGRIITVFGCGGDRDRTKRPKMGAAAAAESDMVVVTSDNPRNEDPQAIIAEIEPGLAQGGMRRATGRTAPGEKEYLVVPDRREAVAAALALARPNDLVVLAGKGHEDQQIVGEKRLPFDDRKVAREELRRMGAAGTA